MDLKPNIAFVAVGAPMLVWLVFELRRTLRSGRARPFVLFDRQFSRDDEPADYWLSVGCLTFMVPLIGAVILLS